MPEHPVPAQLIRLVVADLVSRIAELGVDRPESVDEALAILKALPDISSDTELEINWYAGGSPPAGAELALNARSLTLSVGDEDGSQEIYRCEAGDYPDVDRGDLDAWIWHFQTLHAPEVAISVWGFSLNGAGSGAISAVSMVGKVKPKMEPIASLDRDDDDSYPPPCSDDVSPPEPQPVDLEPGGLRSSAGDFVQTSHSLVQKLAWNLDKCVTELLARHVSGENVAYALIDYASASVALQRRVRADYITMRRQNRPGVYPPYIHHTFDLGASVREQIYSRIAFQAALADLAEMTTRGLVREKRWEDGAVRIRLEATADYQELLEVVEGDPELEASLIEDLVPQAKVWWMPVFERTAPDACWRGVGALRKNLEDWRQLVFDLTPFLD